MHSDTLDVVIFCGGRGTRLMERTRNAPKPLVEIGDQPILWHIMKIYNFYGHKRFILPLGFKGEMIKEYFLSYAWKNRDFELNLSKPELPTNNLGWKIVFKNTGIETKTAKRLFLVKNLIKSDPFMVTYGDGVADIDLNALLKRHEQLTKDEGAIATITAVRPYSKYGIIKIDEHYVKEFKEKPVMDEYINAGFMVFDSAIFDYLSSDRDTMLVDDVLPQLAREGKLGYYRHDGFWHALDTYKDYVELNKRYINGAAKWIIWKK